MTAASKPNHHHHHHPSTSKPPKNPISSSAIAAHSHPQNPNPNFTLAAAASPFAVSEQDQVLSRATHLTRQELLKRRSRNLKQLSRCYRDHYWALMEELKIQYRDYYWNYGVSPFKDDRRRPDSYGGVLGGESGDFDVEVTGENNNGGDLELKSNQRCLFVGCKIKAMALTSFCHLHILSDSKQKLYKPCGYVIKSAQAGPITCGKPIMRSTTPSLCSVHFQKAQKHVTQALKKAGLNVSSSSKLAPKFHVIVAEYVRQIQAKRRAAKNGNRSKVPDEEASTG